jgi:hypothetical protein
VTTEGERPATPPRRRLPSIFDQFLAGTPVTLDALEKAMAADTERRIRAVLDRVLARRPDGGDPNPAPPGAA